jgi:hypothetical protein
MPSISKGKRPKYREPERIRTSKTARSIHKTYRWRKLSERIRKTAWCAVCDLEGITKQAEDLDHGIRLQDGGAPWAPSNHLPLCKHHHGWKTRIEVNGYRPPSRSTDSGLVPIDPAQVAYDVLAASKHGEQ